MEKLNLENIAESTVEKKESKKIVPGGYVCEIKSVTDCPIGYNPRKPEVGNFLKIEYDIDEGEFEDYYKELQEKFNFWGGSYIRSYKETALGVFKGFINAVEKSNPGFTWNWNEEELVGKKVGFVLGPEPYTGMDGKTKVKMKVVAVKSVDDIRAGNYKTPDDIPVESEPVAVTVVGSVDNTVNETADSLEKISGDVPF